MKRSSPPAEIASDAEDALEVLADALSRSVFHPAYHADLALFHATYARRARRRSHAALARALAASHEAWLSKRPSPRLHGGRAGLLWLWCKLADEDTAPRADDLARDLTRVVRRGRWRGRHDLIEGLVGIGHAALAMPAASAGAELVDAVVERLARDAVSSSQGVAWLTPARLSPTVDPRKRIEQVNLGVAHGVPGVIAFLARVATRQASPRLSSLLAGAIDFVLANCVDGTELPYRVSLTSGPPTTRARVAWCYGNPGGALALAHGATALGDARRLEAARRLAKGSARRALSSGGAKDAGLCHGAFGNALLFERLGATEAAQRWWRHGFSMRERGRGIAGFRSYAPATPGAADDTAYVTDPSFLTGASGIGLSLIELLWPGRESGLWELLGFEASFLLADRIGVL